MSAGAEGALGVACSSALGAPPQDHVLSTYTVLIPQNFERAILSWKLGMAMLPKLAAVEAGRCSSVQEVHYSCGISLKVAYHLCRRSRSTPPALTMTLW